MGEFFGVGRTIERMVVLPNFPRPASSYTPRPPPPPNMGHPISPNIQPNKPASRPPQQYWRMIQEDIVLQAKLKCGIIKDLFSQILKNTKSDRAFYMNVSAEGVKMIFMESDKEVEIYIYLRKEVFQWQYAFNKDSAIIYKFDIRDLELLNNLFENPSFILTLTFSDECLKVSYESEFSGQCTYSIHALSIDDAIPDEVLTTDFGHSEQLHTTIMVNKTKTFSNVLHALGLMRYDNFELTFRSVEKAIQVVPLPSNISTNSQIEDSDISYRVSVAYMATQMLDHLRFSLKKFKTGLGLFEKNEPIMLSFYTNCVKLEVMSKEKKDIIIMLASLADL